MVKLHALTTVSVRLRAGCAAAGAGAGAAPVRAAREPLQCAL